MPTGLASQVHGQLATHSGCVTGHVLPLCLDHALHLPPPFAAERRRVCCTRCRGYTPRRREDGRHSRPYTKSNEDELCQILIQLYGSRALIELVYAMVRVDPVSIDRTIKSFAMCSSLWTNLTSLPFRIAHSIRSRQGCADDQPQMSGSKLTRRVSRFGQVFKDLHAFRTVIKR